MDLPREPADVHLGDAATLLEQAGRAGRDGDHLTAAGLADAALAHGGLDEAGRARAMSSLALHRLRLGEHERAVEHGLKALLLLDQGTDLATRALTHCTLALAFHQAGLHEKAVAHVHAASEDARASEDPTAQFWAMTRTAMLHDASGDADRSDELERAALELALQIGEHDVVVAGLNNLPMSLLSAAESLRDDEPGSGAAAALAEEALQLLDRAVQTVGDQPARATLALSNKAGALVDLGRFDEADEVATEAGELARRYGYRGLELSCAGNRTNILRASGRTAEALAETHRLVDLPEVADEPEFLAELHLALYEMHKDRGEFEDALRHHEEHHALRTRLDAERAGVQSRILLSTLEVDRARRDAERSRLEAHQATLRAEDLAHQASTDALTGLPNRRALERDLPGLVQRARAGGHPLAAAMVDLDHFKEVNDVHGHAVGDQVLRAMAGILREATRERDLAVRTGGEEFLLVMVDATADQAAQACERLLHAVRSHPWDEVREGLRCTVSAGVAALDGTETAPEWLSRADAALYRAKDEGRDRVCR